MSTQELRSYLDERHIDYTLINHSLSYTEQETTELTYRDFESLVHPEVVHVEG